MNLAHEKTATRAYGLYVERNGNAGSQLEDWLKAEKEVSKVNVEQTEKKHFVKLKA